MELKEVPLVPLTSSQEDLVLENTNYSRSKLTGDILSLKRWVSEERHLPPSASREPDEFFSNFLLGCKGEMSKAQTKIKNYYEFRRRAPEFSNRDPLDQRSKAMWPYFQHLTLPKATKDGCRVFMSSCSIPDYPDYEPSLISKRIFAILEVRLRCEMIQGGEYLVMDGNNYSASYFFGVRPHFIRNIVYFVQNVFPWRIKGIIFLNTPTFVQLAVTKLIKPLLNSKISKRLHVYTEGLEVLKRHFSEDILPKDYGGEADTRQQLSDRWMELISQTHWRNWLMNEGSELVEVEENADKSVRSMFKTFWR